MAATYKYEDVWGLLQKQVSRLDEATFGNAVANLGTNLVWLAFDWRESLQTLPPFYLIPGEQDFYPPATIIPTDFHSLRQCYLTQVSGSQYRAPLSYLDKDLSLTHVKGLPASISYQPQFGGFRLFPRCGDNLSAPEWMVEGTYKKRAAHISNTNLNTVLPFDDLYLDVMIDSCLWAAKKLSGSPDAGEVQMQNGNVVYTGQLAKAMDSISRMAASEGYQDGASFVAPSEPLAMTSSNWMGSVPALIR